MILTGQATPRILRNSISGPDHGSALQLSAGRIALGISD